MRRLITLIFAGRNRIIVIRLEIPPPEDASWVQTHCDSGLVALILTELPLLGQNLRNDTCRNLIG
jgi:hypothetical protein